MPAGDHEGVRDQRVDGLPGAQATVEEGRCRRGSATTATGAAEPVPSRCSRATPSKLIRARLRPDRQGRALRARALRGPSWHDHAGRWITALRRAGHQTLRAGRLQMSLERLIVPQSRVIPREAHSATAGGDRSRSRRYIAAAVARAPLRGEAETLKATACRSARADPVESEIVQPASITTRERDGTANLAMMSAPLEGWRRVQGHGSPHRRRLCARLERLADIHFRRTRTIVLVHDNLDIHSKASLYEAFAAAEAWRLAERLRTNHSRRMVVMMELQLDFYRACGSAPSQLNRRSPSAQPPRGVGRGPHVLKN